MRQPVWILQIDAHIDWRDEVHGERCGYSSPMRRASEMPHVAGIVQVGLRSVGSARLTDIEAARHYGSRLVTAREVHAQGIEPHSGIFRKEQRSSSRSTATASIPASCRAWRRLRPAASPIRR
jgi:arginase family enzyme